MVDSPNNVVGIRHAVLELANEVESVVGRAIGKNPQDNGSVIAISQERLDALDGSRTTGAVRENRDANWYCHSRIIHPMV